MMAENLENGEFWLPAKFLSDDNLAMEFGKSKGNNGGSEFSYGFGLSRPNSDLSSPGESVMGSTETESDEDDILFGLSRKLGQTSLSDDLWKVESGFGFENKKWSSNMATSPQSTLCNVMGGGCGCKQGSSRGSPNSISPPVVGKNETAWNLLYAAAGEVAKIKKIEEAEAFVNYSSRVAQLGGARKQSPVFVQAKNPNVGFRTNQSMSYQQLQANQFQQLKQQQLMKLQQQQQQQGSLRWSQQQMILQNRSRNVTNGRPLGSATSDWPTLQQSQQHSQQQLPGSGMRAVFLGNPGAKRASSGTGVFLPRLAGTTTENVKKKGCSTVLLPDRVVQALNLNLKAMESTAPQLLNRSNSNNAVISPDYDAAMKYRNSVLMAEAQAQQRRNAAMQRQPLPVSNELRLPQEWTY